MGSNLIQDFSDLEIYFHVGVERTGTKYLQKSIFPTYKGIHFINKDEYFNAKQIIAKRKHKRYLVSMELNLSPQFEAEVKDFSRWFPNAKTIMVLRPHDKWLVSHYKRIVKNGEKKTFKQFLDLETEESIYKIEDLYYMNKIEILEKYFNPEPLYLLYGDLRKDPVSYLNRIATYLKVDFDINKINLKPRHTSYSENQLKAIQRTRNYINIDRKKPSKNKIINLLHRIYIDAIRYSILRLAKHLPNSYFRDSPFIEPEEVEAVKDFYQKDWDQAVVYVRSKE